MKNRFMFGVGSLFVVLGILLNPWTIASVLSPDGKIASSLLNIRIFAFEGLLIGAGVVVIRNRHALSFRTKHLVPVGLGFLLIASGILSDKWILGLFFKHVLDIRVWIYNAIGIGIGTVMIVHRNRRFLTHAIGRGILIFLCAISLACVFWVSFRAIPFPYELEWGESACLDMAARINDGKPLYPIPSLEYIPTVYNFLYFYISGYAAKVAGLSLPLLRSISFGCFLLTLLVMGFWMKHEKRRWTLALIAMGIYAASFELSGAWIHLARIDSMFVLFLFFGTVLLHTSHRPWGMVVSALLVFLAFLTKQSTILYVPFLTLYLVLYKPKHVKYFLSVICVLVGISVVVGNALTAGRYYWYIFAFQPQRGFYGSYVIAYFKQFAVPLGWLGLFLLGTAVYVGATRQVTSFLRMNSFYLFMAAVSLIISLASISQHGAYYNNMMPFYLYTAMLIANSIQFVETVNERRFPRAIGYALICLLPWSTIFNPQKYIPARNDYQAGERIVSLLKAVEGPVWVTHTTSYYYIAKKERYVHMMPLIDIMRCNRVEYRLAVQEQINEAISKKTFAAVIDGAEWIQELFGKNGYRAETILLEYDAPRMKTGMPYRPDTIYYRDR